MNSLRNCQPMWDGLGKSWRELGERRVRSWSWRPCDSNLVASSAGWWSGAARSRRHWATGSWSWIHHLKEGCGRWRGAGHQDYLEAHPQLLLGEETEEPRSGGSDRGIFTLEHSGAGVSSHQNSPFHILDHSFYRHNHSYHELLSPTCNIFWF